MEPWMHAHAHMLFGGARGAVAKVEARLLRTYPTLTQQPGSTLVT